MRMVSLKSDEARVVQYLTQKIPFFYLEIMNTDVVVAFRDNCFESEAPSFVADLTAGGIFIIEDYLVPRKPYVP